MITVQLVGGASLRSGDAPLTGPPAQRHRIALLTLVVAAWPQPLSRDRAMAMLWPEKDLPSARRLLNLAVHVLRSALGEGAIASAGDGLVLNPSLLNCDLHELRAAIAAEEPERIVRLYTGPLLDGFHLDDSTDFGYWLDEHRNELAHAYIGALLRLARRQEQSGDVHGWVGTCLRLVAVDPHSAVYAQALMRALDAAGDRAGALNHANEYSRRRRADLDLGPDAEVVALAEQLRSAPPRRQATIKASSPVSSTSVAVLPFLNLSQHPDNEYFADGITEDVIAHLSKIRALKVISRTSVMQFKLRQHTLKEIGAKLGVTTLLDGSVRHAGDRVRIVAKLIDVQTDKHLWVETYDRQLTDIFSIQTDVALQIAAALKAELSPEEQTRVRKEPTGDLQAYKLFLKGRQWFIKYNTEAYRNAIEYFDRAIARDPKFAGAWANLAMAYTELAESGVTAPDVAYERAADAAANALRLDPDLAAAHCTTAHIMMTRDLDWSGAEREFKRALELSPSDDDSYDLYGRLCAGLGRYDEAIALQRRAHDLDPLAHRMDMVTSLLRAGRYDQAVLEAKDAVDLEPGYDRARATLGWAYFLSGRKEEGLAELEEAVAISPGNTMWLGQLGEAYAMAGDVTKAREILRELQKRAKTGYVSPYHFAYVFTGLGDTDQAMDCVERAVAARTGPVYSIKGSFLLTALHSHPRFHALLRQMKLE
ncbi:MAG: tetratricopeptide repeat protein [Gemmatimonadaceae bacterium]